MFLPHCGTIRVPQAFHRHGKARAPCACATERKIDMDKDRVNGAGNKAKGAVKGAVGKMTGDAKLQAEGKADKAKGTVQNAVGGTKDSIREATDKK